MTQLIPIHNPHPGGTCIWFSVPDGAVIAAEADRATAAAEAAEPEPEAEL